MQSPVSYPFIWSVPDNIGREPKQFEWIHYDGDTNSILERNIGQSLGMGSVFDPVTYESTLRIGNHHELEVLTHKLQPPKWPADVLSDIDAFQICTAYEVDGERTTDFPGDAFLLEKCKPVYETLPGWKKEIGGARKLADLPNAARKYVDRLAELIGLPVTIVSVGPDREQTVFLR